MILVTGGAGFIGSGLIWGLNQANYINIVVADRLGTGPKWQNLAKRQIRTVVHKDNLFSWLESSRERPRAVFHMGACSSTTEADADYLIRNNFQYSVDLFLYCVKHQIPFFYASSAATYGLGEHGYEDRDDVSLRLRAINKYGYSKQLFDSWVLAQKDFPPAWAGFKFFNVYGPGEYHKGTQASVVLHAHPQVRDQKTLRLFKSYREGIGHGEQKRDFVYVKDVVKVLLHFFHRQSAASSGIYNLGTGKAQSFCDLGRAVFEAMQVAAPSFSWIEMPGDIRGQYQYFTEAQLSKLRGQGSYPEPFTSLSDGVKDYIQNYLATDDPYL